MFSYGPNVFSAQCAAPQPPIYISQSFPDVPSQPATATTSAKPLGAPTGPPQTKSCLTACLQNTRIAKAAPPMAPVAELSAILQNAESAENSPATTYLGMSPPVRSGACNPFCADRSWLHQSRTNLAALQDILGPDGLPLGSLGASPMSFGSESGSWVCRGHAQLLSRGSLSCRGQQLSSGFPSSWSQHQQA